jgi:ABC-type uncharacterized transport system substrate-binding protein
MVRRDLLALLVLATAVWPLAAVAQDGNRRIGLLGVPPPSDPIIAPLWQVFVEALGNKGWMEDRNIIFDRRWSQGRPETYPELAAAVVATKPDLIIALSSQAMQAARQKTDRIPVVAIGLSDLVELGLVASLARPGRNLTGFGIERGAFNGKVLQLFQEARPGLSRLSLLYTPSNPASKSGGADTISIAQRLGIRVDLVPVDAPEDFDKAFAALAQNRPDGLIVHATPVLFGNDRKIASFALEQRIPTMAFLAGSVRNGMLLSYAADQKDMWSRAAGVVDKILRGANPAEIPIELPTKFVMAINLKTAKALGLSLPQSLLARADEIIE